MTDTTTQPGEDRQSFMARVHAALERAEAKSPAEPDEQAPAVDEALMRLASATDDVVGILAQRAEAVGMIVHRVPTEQAASKVLAILRETQHHRVVVAAGEAGRMIQLDQAIEQAADVELVDWRGATGRETAGNFAVQYDVDAGITDVHAALAETGTLICCSDASHSRGLSLVPPHHIALVRTCDILPDMIDYWHRVAGLPPEDRPSSTALITGPSKTADIEGQLIQGVHGPGRVDVVVIEG